jgi:hypothetical protein
VWSGSWLVALGSWLVALGSWLVALGSWSGVLADVLVCLLDPWGPPDACPSALRCQRLTLSRQGDIPPAGAGVAGTSATMREGGSSVRGGTGGCLAAVSGLPVRRVKIQRCDARSACAAGNSRAGAGRVWAGVWPRCPAALCAVVGRVGFWIQDACSWLVARGSVVWVMRTISVQPLCLALRGIGWEGWLPGP